MRCQSRAAKLLLYVLFVIGVADAQWEKVSVPTSASFRGLSVVSPNVIWASGTGGTVIRTADGGSHWSVITVPGAEKLDFRGIHAFDGATAVVISSGPAENGQARIYRTTDGGATWTQVFAENRKGIFFDAIAFWDRRHGIVLSDPVDGKFALFTTDNAGVTWKQIPPVVLPEALSKEGAFAASNSCLAVQGASNVWFATGGASVARVFRSTDRGRTWNVSDTPMRPLTASSGIFSLAFEDAQNGIAVGGDYQHPESSTLPNMLRTHDGGKSWQAGEPTEPPGVYFSSVTQLKAGVFLAVGIKGAFIYSNGWLKSNDQNLNTAMASIRPFFWAIGPNGTVARDSLVIDIRPTSKP
jgi:photosystem II stability/assembly factor-like uncharacterized protein